MRSDSVCSWGYMETMLEETGCDLCGGESTKELYRMPDLRLKRYSDEYTVVQCLECGHRYLNPRPTISSIPKHYPETYYAGRASSLRHQRKRYDYQAELLPHQGGRILDVGCATGAWLEVIKEKGWECYGTDMIRTKNESREIEIKIGSLPAINYPAAFFDVVTAWGVMEHTPYPSKYFIEIQRILKPGGQFIFLVPNADSLWSRRAYKEDIPRHLHFFRKKTISHYADKCNFSVGNILITNKVYSRPATGRGMFRVQLMRKLGVSWQDIVEGPSSKSLKCIQKIGSIFDLLIVPALEEKFQVCGNMIVTLIKPQNEQIGTI